MIMPHLVKLVKWRQWRTEYQVMVPYSTSYWKPAEERMLNGRYERLWSAETYKDALEQMDRLTPEDRAVAIIAKVRWQIPAGV